MLNSVVRHLRSTRLYRWLRLANQEHFFTEHPQAYADCDPEEAKRIHGQMKRAYILYDIPYLDFWWSRCDCMDKSQWRSVVPYKRQRALWLMINAPSAKELLDDKWKTFQHFREFYHRELFCVPKESADMSGLSAFIERHPCFVVKPHGGRWGIGVHLFDAEAHSDPARYLVERYADGFVAEEFIVQDEALGRFHPESVNTLRIHTYMGPDSIDIKWPCFRMGRGDSFVDNAGAGGIFGAIDVSTGVIIGVGDESHHVYEKHPDTGVQILSFKIPHWEEACEMVRLMAKRIPECRFVAWDLALTQEGWVMVEGNYSPLLIWQFAAGTGMGPEFDPIEKQAKKLSGHPRSFLSENIS